MALIFDHTGVFEWDSEKAESNMAKHGVSFEEAAEMLSGDFVEFVARVKGESRSKALVRMRGEYFAIVFTRRAGGIRIISARHATKKEGDCYEKHID